MNSNQKLAPVAVALLLLLAPTVLPASASPLQPPRQKEEEKKKKQEKKGAGLPTGAAATADERLEADDTAVVPTGVSEQVLANRREQMSEEEQSLVPYYNNFLTSYRLGPEDIISVSVFDEPRYSKANITIPPDGRISYFLMPDGVHVAGKTTRQVEEEIARALDEFIIDPKVTVSLDKAQSMSFGVIGDVAKPGIMTMTRRISVYEAIALAGGVLPTGDKKKVTVMHQQADGMMRLTRVDVAAIEKGKAPNNYYLSPGDQVIVPGNRFKSVQKILNLLPVISFMRIFTGGF